MRDQQRRVLLTQAGRNTKCARQAVIVRTLSVWLLVVLAALAILPEHNARAQMMDCKTYTSHNSEAPTVVKQYLSRAPNLFMSVCGLSGNQHYVLGAGLIKTQGVCRYSLSELRRNARGELQGSAPKTKLMLLENFACPSPLHTPYVVAEGISPATFEEISYFWNAVVSSRSSLRSHTISTSKSDTLRKFMQAGEAHSQNLRLAEIRAKHDFGVWKAFILRINDPENSSRFYLLTISKWFGGGFRIDDVGFGEF